MHAADWSVEGKEQGEILAGLLYHMTCALLMCKTFADLSFIKYSNFKTIIGSGFSAITLGSFLGLGLYKGCRVRFRVKGHG